MEFNLPLMTPDVNGIPVLEVNTWLMDGDETNWVRMYVTYVSSQENIGWLITIEAGPCILNVLCLWKM